MRKKKLQNCTLDHYFFKIIIILLASLTVLQTFYVLKLTGPEAYLHVFHSQHSREALSKNVSKLTHRYLQELTEVHIIDRTGVYFIVPNIIKPIRTFKVDNQTGVTICIHCTPNHLKYLPQLVKQWKGPISVSVFTNGDETITAVKYVINQHLCDENIRNLVSFHFVFPIRNSTTNMNKLFDEPFHCDRSYANTGADDANYDNKDVPYPSNIVRNVAVEYSSTPYILVLDIDFVPSRDLYSQLQYFLQRQYRNSKSSLINSKTAFVLPCFESKFKDGESMTKEALKKKIEEGSVRPFYEQACKTCQEDTEYEKWLHFPSMSFLEKAYEIEWQMPWEPFYMAHRTHLPLYDSRFKQYGFNRVSQICEMHMTGYQFLVLNNAFLVHRGFKDKSNFHTDKAKEHQTNKILFSKFKDELKERYERSGRLC